MAERETLSCQLVVIGAGASGLMGAVEAARSGLDVIVLDRRDELGGNARLATAHAAVESAEQRARGISLTKDTLYQAMLEVSDGNAQPRLLRRFVERSADVVDRLRGLGVEYERVTAIDPIRQLPVSHLPVGRMRTVVESLTAESRRLGVRSFPGFRALQIETSDGLVSGVRARDTEGAELVIECTAALIATGGFAANPGLLRRYSGLPQARSAGSGADTGDGLALAVAAGGHASNLIGPVLMVATTNGRPIAEDIACACVQPTLWVDHSGRRFCNEALTLTLSQVGNVVIHLDRGYAWSIFDRAQIDQLVHNGAPRGLGSGAVPGAPLRELPAQFEADLAEGRTAFRADSLEELADLIGVDVDTFLSEVSQYHDACAEGVDNRYFKTSNLDPLLCPPFSALRVEAVALCSTGAIEVDEYLRVLDHYGNPIGGLYAAGNDAAGPWGKTAVTIVGGAPAGFALTSGMLAGEHAVSWCRHR